MLAATPELVAILRQSYVTRMHVNSWRGDELLYTDIPASAGSLTMDRSLNVPERVTLTVPREADGRFWTPRENDHPLSPYGQRLQVSVGIDVAGTEEILQLGWFPVTDTSTSGDTVSVTAEGMLKLVDEAKFIAPFEPTGSIVDTIRALVEPVLTVIVDPALVDRNMPIGMKWDEDRLGALNEVIDAWPAEAFVTEYGYLHVIEVPDPTTDTPVYDIRDDRDDGTLIAWSGAATREGAYNIVVARGENSTNEQVQAIEFDDDQSSSTMYGGPFNPLPVPFFFYSPLLTTVAQCRKAAGTTMARKRRARAKSVAVDMIPNPTLQLGDVVTVTTNELTGARATIENISLPLNPGGGDMSLTLSVVGGG